MKSTNVINSSDLLYKVVSNSVYATRTESDGTYVSDYDYVDIWAFTPGFLDYEISVSPIKCGAGENGLGVVIVNFQKGPQTGSYELVEQEDGRIISHYFENKATVPIELPSGEYALTLFDGGTYPHLVPGVHKVEESQPVDFVTPPDIEACLLYRFSPEGEEGLEFTLKDPKGTILTLQSDGFYELSTTGTYSITGVDPFGTRCPVEKTFNVDISQPLALDVEILPFCSEDVFTTVKLLEDTNGSLVKWYKLEADGKLHLIEHNNSTTLTAQEEGEYEVTLTDGEGCIRGRGRVQVARSIIEAPRLNELYTICPTSNSNVSLTAGSQFVASKWYLDGIEVGNALSYVPDQAGLFSLVATDRNGCELFADFEVEVKCEPTIRYPNAIKPGIPDKAFILYPDNLTEELQVIIQNRWGEMIFYCQDKNPQFGKASACIWDGTVNNKKVPNGSYQVTIRYKTKDKGLVLTEKGMISVVE